MQMGTGDAARGTDVADNLAGVDHLTFLHQTLRLSVYAAYNASNRDYFVNPELRYSFTDRVWGAVGANAFGGKPWGQFGQFARDDNIYLQLRYEF